LGGHDGKVRIYALADPAPFAEARQAIERIVLQALKVAPSDRHRVDISESSAWLTYEASGELWRRHSAPQLPTRTNAQRTAESLLVELERLCSNANPRWPDRLRGLSLLPPVALLKMTALLAVPRPDGSAWDHWLYRAQPRLALTENATNRADVFGAQIEVRIGHGRQPITIRFRWRPLSRECAYADPSPYQPSDDTHASGGEEGTPTIVYVLQGDGVPQYYLAPYYCVVDEHGAEMTSASPYSLTVVVKKTQQQRERMTLVATAQGGSGDYAYNWGCYSLTRFEEGILEIGPGRSMAVEDHHGRTTASTIDIANGSYIIMVNVKDRATGAFQHHQQQVFSTPYMKSDDGERAGAGLV